MLDGPWESPPDADALVRAALRWHFDPTTGSRFWLDLAPSLGFDPRADIAGAADLVRFPDVSARLRTARVDDMVPAGLRATEGPPLVFESGGTTGPPKRIVDLTFWRRSAHWLSARLDEHGVPGGHWLYLGPTGPHVAGHLFAMTAALRGGACLTVDFDPRWVKRAQPGQLDPYLAHILDQAAWVLAGQAPGVLWATPPILVALADRPDLLARVGASVHTIVWSGTSATPETLRLLETEVFPGIRLVGIYGNTIMGVAPQRPRVPGDEHGCVFRPFHPHSLIELIDPDTGAPVGYGERGQVRLHHITLDLFLPNMVERDTALRIAPVSATGSDRAGGMGGTSRVGGMGGTSRAGGMGGTSRVGGMGQPSRVDGLADVRPLPRAGEPVREGVY